MGRPCVAGASEVKVDARRRARCGSASTELAAGDFIAIEGTTGRVTADEVPLIEPEISQEFDEVLGWADELRRLGVRANADTAEDAANARQFGAEGIGLCRTEHMFFGEDRGRAGPGDVRGRRAVAEGGGQGRRRRRARPARARGGARGVPRRARSPGRTPAPGLQRDPPRDAGAAGDRPPAGSADARVPPARALRGRRAPARGRRRRPPDLRARGRRDRARPPGGEPDAGHSRRAPRVPVPPDLRDAGARRDRTRQRRPPTPATHRWWRS